MRSDNSQSQSRGWVAFRPRLGFGPGAALFSGVSSRNGLPRATVIELHRELRGADKVSVNDLQTRQGIVNKFPAFFI